MDQFDYLTRDQLVSLVRVLGAGRGGEHGPAPANSDALPEVGERALRDFESSSSPLRIFDRETLKYLAVNEAAVKFYGYSREEFLALTARDTRHPDEYVEQLASLERARSYIRHGGARRQIKKSGEVVVVEVVTQDILFNGRNARLALTIDLTGRLRMEELLWRRQQEFESLAENLPDLVARFDRDRRFLYANSAIERTLGVNRGLIIGKTQRELGMSGEVAALFDDSLVGVIATGQPHMVEFRLALPSGERKFEAHHVPEMDAAGEIGSVLCVARDITERKHIEQELREANEFLGSVIESSRDCIKVLDLGGRLLLMNSSGRRLLEIDDVVPLLNSDWLEFWRGPNHAAAQAAVDAARSGGVGVFEGYCPTWKGSPRWWDVVVTSIPDADGKPARLLAVSRDVTRRKQARDLRNRLAAIVDHSLDAVISKDLDGVIRTWNPAAERLFGYAADEAVGRSITMLIPPDRLEEEALILERIRGGVPIEAFESVRLAKNGTRVDVSISISPIKDEAGQVTGASTIARDITERKQAELAALRGASLARLLESLARAANEALTPEAAMIACLERICRHGQWLLGRVEIFDRGRPKETPGRSIWYAPERNRFDEFIRMTESHVRSESGPFIGRVLRERTAVWIEDWRQRAGYRRWESAIKHGLLSAFAFPIIVRGEVVAIMEVFSDESRRQDPHLMGAAQSIASQLARIVERASAHEANARMAAIVESSQDAIISRALDGTILTWNSGAERLLGYTAAEIVGRNLEILYPPERKANLFQRQALVLQGKATSTFETERMTKDGRRIQVSLSSAPIRDSSGAACGISTIVRDITESKHIELASRRSEELARLQASLAHAANEATSPEAAMLACLTQICSFGNWVIGRVGLYDDRGAMEGARPRSTIWHAPDRERFAHYMQISDSWPYTKAGRFLGRVLREQVAVWIEDLQQETGFGRRIAALESGLRSAFAFPVIVHGNVVATLEACSDEVRPEDPLTMSAVQSIASQLARIVEREWAHQANAHMAAIVESSVDAMVSRTLDGTILTWNRGAELLFGYTAAEIVGRKIEILYPEELKAEIFKRQKLLLEGRGPGPHETVRVAKDGRRIHVSTSPAAIMDASGNICAVSTIIQDITGRRAAEAALRGSEERFRQLAENMEQVFWINTSAFNNNFYASPAYEKVWGRSLESLRRDPNSWRESILPEDLPKLQKAIEEIARGRHMDIEYRIVRPDGSLRWIRDRSYPMQAGDGTGLTCGIAEDITELKRAEQERLIQAIHQRDALVREVHHRIKNNLQGVAGLLRQKIRKFPDVAPGIEEAIVQLQSVAVVYGLQGTRTDGLVSLAEMVEAICASAEGLIGGRVERAFERKSLRPACVAGSEAVSIAVALNELVFNALKHQSAPAGRKRARVAVRETRDAAEIRITNPGRLPKRFDYSADHATGNGLGLVRTLLASPGVRVEFSSKRNSVEVLLTLRPPLLAERSNRATRRTVDVGAG